MEGVKPRLFDECFPEGTRGDRNFSAYMSIVSNAEGKPSVNRPEKHHVVPREWLTENSSGFSFGNEDPLNIVYLSVKEKVLAYQRLMLIFLDRGDSLTYRKLTETFSRRYHVGWYGLWKNPYMDKDKVDELATARAKELSSKKRKYPDEFMERCAEILDAEKNQDDAFERIRNELGYAHSKAALVGTVSRWRKAKRK